MAKSHVYEKFHDVNILCESEYEMPILSCIVKAKVERLIPWTLKAEDTDGTLHFWIDDYKFNSLVTYPRRNMYLVQRFQNVIQPDHSSYGNWNYNVQRYQQFLRQWVAAIWTYYGKITVIPNIHLPYNDDSKWDFFWAGIPHKSIIAISGQRISDVMHQESDQAWFLHGFDVMMEKLEPRHVIYYGGRIKKLEQKWGHLITRFSRHSFIGQQSNHEKYITGTDQLTGDEIIWDQENKQQVEVPLNTEWTTRKLPDKKMNKQWNMPPQNENNLLNNNSWALPLNHKESSGESVEQLPNGQEKLFDENLNSGNNQQPLILQSEQDEQLKNHSPVSCKKPEKKLLEQKISKNKLSMSSLNSNQLVHEKLQKKSVLQDQNQLLYQNSLELGIPQQKNMLSQKLNRKKQSSTPISNFQQKPKSSEQTEKIKPLQNKLMPLLEDPSTSINYNTEQLQLPEDIRDTEISNSELKSWSMNKNNNEPLSKLEKFKDLPSVILLPSHDELEDMEDSETSTAGINLPANSNGVTEPDNDDSAEIKLEKNENLDINEPLSIQNLRNTQCCLVLNGLSEPFILMQYLEQMGISVMKVFLDHDWLFPEVRAFLLKQHAIPIQTIHRFTTLLVKYGWPAMRGGCKAWHLRELEQTVDRYLKETDSIEVVPFDSQTNISHLQGRKRRKTLYSTPFLLVDIQKDIYQVPQFMGLYELQDKCESHYLSPVKGLMYTALRPKHEIEWFYQQAENYQSRYVTSRAAKSEEMIWPKLIELNDQIKKKPSYFNSYSTLLDYIYEFEGRFLDKYVDEYEESYIFTGNKITQKEWRERRIQKAINDMNWMWAINHRDPIKWYVVKPLAFSESRKKVLVRTQEGIGHERYIPITNLYSRPAENYQGKIK
jgi:hypothetical protein